MRFKDARKYVEYSYQASLYTASRPIPICFLGGPGIGKTVCVKEAARNIAGKLGRVFIDFNDFERLSDTMRNQLLKESMEKGGPFFLVDLNMLTHEPMDFSGKPAEASALLYNDGAIDEVVEKKITTFLPTAWVPYLQEYPGMLFIDEVTNIRRPDLMSVMLKMVGEHKVGYAYLNNDVMIILAGNRPEQSFLATGLPEPLRSRVEIIDFEPPLPHEWMAYVQKQYGDILDAAAAGYLCYLASTPEARNPDVMAPMVTPRTCDYLVQKVSNCARIYRLGLIHADELHFMVEESAHGIIGPKEGSIFAEWYRNNMDIIDYMRKGINEKHLRNISPCAVWGILAVLGQAIPKTPAEVEEILTSPLNREVLENLGSSIKATIAAGKEHAPGILIGGNMFAGGNLDNVRSSCGRLQFLKQIMEGTHPGKAAHLLDSYNDWGITDFEEVINSKDSAATRDVNPFYVDPALSEETRAVVQAASLLMASHVREFLG